MYSSWYSLQTNTRVCSSSPNSLKVWQTRYSQQLLDQINLFSVCLHFCSSCVSPFPDTFHNPGLNGPECYMVLDENLKVRMISVPPLLPLPHAVLWSQRSCPACRSWSRMTMQMSDTSQKSLWSLWTTTSNLWNSWLSSLLLATCGIIWTVYCH